MTSHNGVMNGPFPATTTSIKALFDMEEDRLYPHILDIAADSGIDGIAEQISRFHVADLPDDIMELAEPFQEIYSDSEQEKVQALVTTHLSNLSTINAAIRSMDEQIARLHALRGGLLSKRDQESRNIAILRAITSPIRRVPIDVLCEIFVHCLPDPPTMAPTNVLKAYEAPLLLCKVCTKWRRTAIACPLLWKALALRASYAFDHETKLIITIHPSVSPILDSWFSRAGSCPLSFGLDLQCQNGKPSEFTLTHKLEDIFDRLPSSRLQHLSLSALWPSDTYALSHISHEFTQLESIFLQAVSGTDSMPVPHRLLQSAPRLHSAELHDFIEPGAFPKSLIPWSQLTYLHVEGLGEVMWYILIYHCINLRHGIFLIDRDGTEAPGLPTSDHNVTLPHLVDLTVLVTEYGEKPDFRQLAFPSIRRLQLLFEGPMSQISVDSVHTWDGHLPPTDSGSLNCLVIVGVVNFTAPQIRSLLELLPSVTELHLSVGTDYNEFFKALASSSYSPQLLPNLEVLHCDIRDNTDAVLQSLLSFVQSRWWDELSSTSTRTITRLRHLTFKCPATVNDGDFMHQVSKLLAPFEDEGLSLVLDTSSEQFKNLRNMMKNEPE